MSFEPEIMNWKNLFKSQIPVLHGVDWKVTVKDDSMFISHSVAHMKSWYVVVVLRDIPVCSKYHLDEVYRMKYTHVFLNKVLPASHLTVTDSFVRNNTVIFSVKAQATDTGLDYTLELGVELALYGSAALEYHSNYPYCLSHKDLVIAGICSHSYEITSN